MYFRSACQFIVFQYVVNVACLCAFLGSWTVFSESPHDSYHPCVCDHFLFQNRGNGKIVSHTKLLIVVAGSLLQALASTIPACLCSRRDALS